MMVVCGGGWGLWVDSEDGGLALPGASTQLGARQLNCFLARRVDPLDLVAFFERTIRIQRTTFVVGHGCDGQNGELRVSVTIPS